MICMMCLKWKWNLQPAGRCCPLLPEQVQFKDDLIVSEGLQEPQMSKTGANIDFKIDLYAYMTLLVPLFTAGADWKAANFF